MKQVAKEHFAQIAATFFDTLDENGLTVSDFSYGKQVSAAISSN